MPPSRANRGTPGFWPRVLEMAAGLSLLNLLFSSAARAFQDLRGTPPLIDVNEFIDGARNSTVWFDTGIREPLYCWFLRVAMLAVDSGDFAARYVTVLHTMLMGAATYFLARRCAGVLVAVTAAALLSTSLTVHYFAVFGLRDPLYATVLLLVAAVALHPLHAREPPRAGLLLGLVVGLTYLTRSYGLLVAAGLCALALLHQRAWLPERRAAALRRLAWALLPAAALVVLDVALRPRTMLSDHVRFFRNIEIYGNPDAVPTDPSVTLFQYVWGEHTLWHIVLRVAGNYVMFVRTYLPSFCDGYRPVAAAWMAAACAWALLRGKTVWVAALVFLLAPIVFFLNLDQVPGSIGVDKRLVLQAMPFSWILMAWALWRGVMALLGRAAARWPSLERVHGVLLPLSRGDERTWVA